MEDYRTRIYKNYGTNFQDSKEIFDEKVASRWGRGCKYYFRRWLNSEDKNENIVDVACGNGKLLYLFKQLGYKSITGVDISPEQVKLARQVTPNIYQSNVLNWLKEHPSEFDLITGFDIIEHFNKTEVMKFLDSCFIALKSNGRLILQTSNADSPWGSTHRYGDFTHEVGFNPNSLTRLLKLAGFNVIEARETGPVPWGYSVKSTFRYIIWQFIRIILKIWNLAETGSTGSKVFTRIFIISGKKM